MSERQPELFPMSDRELIAHLRKVLKERGKHSLYCCWNGQYYDKSLGCTCGISEALEATERNRQ